MKTPDLVELLNLLEGHEVPDDAHEAHADLADVLRCAGWAVRREVAVCARGDGSAGRVDIEATRGEQVIGIEIDRRRPRRKSVLKLRSRSWARVIALRDPDPEFDLPVPDDLAIVRLRTRDDSRWTD